MAPADLDEADPRRENVDPQREDVHDRRHEELPGERRREVDPGLDLEESPEDHERPKHREVDQIDPHRVRAQLFEDGAATPVWVRERVAEEGEHEKHGRDGVLRRVRRLGYRDAAAEEVDEVLFEQLCNHRQAERAEIEPAPVPTRAPVDRP